MAMSGDGMGEAVAKAIMAAAGGDPSQKETVEWYWKVICGAMVEHIQTNAKVKVGIEVKTTGSPAAQEGKTTTEGEIE